MQSVIILADNHQMLVFGSCLVQICLADNEIDQDILAVEGFQFAALLGNV